jgi:hydrogenase nickel incorporation protein HypA/HybF
VHELSIAMNVVSLAGEAAADGAGDARIEAVRIRIGELSGVVVEALEFAWDVAREGTACADARLEVQRVAARVYCPDCDAEADLEPPLRFRCPRCDRPTADVVAGREMELVALELFDDPGGANAADPSSDRPTMEPAHAAPHP